MLTFFSVPKPFVGNINIIQRNAINSWLMLKPKPEIILFGNEQGVCEISKEINIVHFPDITYNEFGTPLLDYIFDCAQKMASNSKMVFINTDIILGDNFVRAVSSIPFTKYFMVGKRWNLDVCKELSLNHSYSDKELAYLLSQGGIPHSYWGADYFVFPKGMITKIPPFAIGRLIWDNWLIYKARSLGVPVVDASNVVIAIHQNHGYRSKVQNENGGWNWHQPEVARNLALAGGHSHKYNLYDSTWVLKGRDIFPALGSEYIQQRFYRSPFNKLKLNVFNSVIVTSICFVVSIFEFIRNQGIGSVLGFPFRSSKSSCR